MASARISTNAAHWCWNVLLFALIVACLALPGPVSAQEKVVRQLEDWKQEIAETEKQLIRSDLRDADIAKLRTRLEEIRTDTLQVIEGLQPELLDLEKRAEQLKPPEDAPTGQNQEPPALVAERSEVSTKVTALRALIKQLDDNALVASQVSNRAASLQRNRFLKRIFEQERSVLNPLLWIEGFKHSTALFNRLQFIFKNWVQATAETQTFLGWVARLGVLLLAYVIIWPLRLRLQKWLGPNLSDPEPTLLDRLWRAVYLPVTNCFVVAFAFGVMIFAATHFTEAYTLRIGRVAAIAMEAFLAFVFLSSASRGVLSPAAAGWRLPNISTHMAVRLNGLFVLLASVFSINVFMTDLSTALFLPVEFSVMQGAVASISVAVLLVAMLLLRPEATGEESDAPVQPVSETGLFGWAVRLRGLFWLLAAAIMLGVLLGYISLSTFLSEQFVITGSLIVAVYLLHHLADEALTSGLARGLVLGDFVRRTFSLNERGVGRLGLTLTTAVDILLMFVIGPLIVLQWTVTWIDLKSWMSIAFFGFRVGEITISPSAILIGIGVFLAVYIVTRLMVQWLDQRLLRRTQMDRGIRDSIKTAASYSGVILAVLLAATYAGLDFTNLAIVAGALSVGIGFGLQSIVNNFVSGLILLAERPIRVGDWIVVGTDEGTVREINVRATEIETFDRASVIIPNSNLITGTVKNWTHNDKMGRLRIPVGVSYDSDPEQVRELLLQVAADESMVMRSPEPYVFFIDFGPSSLDFELRCYIVDVDDMITVLSNLRYAIVKTLRENGIEIPFPQQDVHFKGLDKLQEAVASATRPDPSPKSSGSS